MLIFCQYQQKVMSKVSHRNANKEEEAEISKYTSLLIQNSPH